jgi:hypothetical protein
VQDTGTARIFPTRGGGRTFACIKLTFFYWRAPQQMIRMHRSLEAYCATLFLRFHFNWAPVEWNWQGKTEVLGKKTVPVPPCPPQNLHGQTRDQTRVFAVRGRRLTAWAIAQPLKLHLGCLRIFLWILLGILQTFLYWRENNNVWKLF